jgi:FAD-linked oxidoreductase
MDDFTNWAGNHRCSPRRIHDLSTTGAVADLIESVRRQGETLRMTGAGHSWSDICCTDGHIGRIDGLDEVVELDRRAGTVTVQAGLRLGDLVKWLLDRGYALANLGSIGEQSVAGVISTGTHGTGLSTGNLSTMVRSLTLVDGRGIERTITRKSDPELFDATRVGLGALGVITQVEFEIVPSFRLRERRWQLTFDQMLDRMDELVDRHEHIKFWWLPHTDCVQVFAADRTDRPPTPPGLTERLDESGILTPLFQRVLQLGATVPQVIPPLNRLVAAVYFNPEDRVAESHEVFNLPMPPKHREAEYGFPLESARPALERLRYRIESEGHRVNFITEVRFVADDDLWLSPSYRRDSCQIGAYVGSTPGWRSYFEAFDEIAAEFGARPHWGKTFFAEADRLREVFPKFDDFNALRRRLDPDGLFANRFIDRVFGPPT